MIARASLFISTLLVTVFVTRILALPLAAYYAYRYFAVELVVLAFLIDVYFGQASNWPFYTLSAFLIVFAAESAKRYLMLQ